MQKTCCTDSDSLLILIRLRELEADIDRALSEKVDPTRLRLLEAQSFVEKADEALREIARPLLITAASSRRKQRLHKAYGSRRSKSKSQHSAC